VPKVVCTVIVTRIVYFAILLIIIISILTLVLVMRIIIVRLLIRREFVCFVILDFISMLLYRYVPRYLLQWLSAIVISTLVMGCVANVLVIIISIRISVSR
jgi:hypothetical protein